MDGIGPIDPLALRLHAMKETPAPADGDGSGFSGILDKLVHETDELQKASDRAVTDFAEGKAENVHDVMLAMNQADLSFRMLLEVRNKLVEAYQEVMRTPV